MPGRESEAVIVPANRGTTAGREGPLLPPRARSRERPPDWVKTALFGGDPNWGRILQTVGAGRIDLDLARAEVRWAGVPVFRAGRSAGPAARRRAGAAIAKPELDVVVDLARGRAEATVWTCDLSYEYVKVNAEYTT